MTEKGWWDALEGKQSGTNGTDPDKNSSHVLTVKEMMEPFAGGPLTRFMHHIKSMYGPAPNRGLWEDASGSGENDPESYPTGLCRVMLIACALVPYCMVSWYPLNVHCKGTTDTVVV